MISRGRRTARTRMERETCWTLIRDASHGKATARETFAERYEPVVRAYLGSRWRGARFAAAVDDAVQDVFVECFKSGGLLERADATEPGGFRAFLFGAVRRVALRIESGRGAAREAAFPTALDPNAVEADEERLSQVFDRAWAQSVLRQAATRHRDLALAAGGDAARRFELLRLRFEEGLAIQAIAERWRADAAELHRAYAKARREFKEALIEIVLEHTPATRAEGETQAAKLLELVG